MKTLHLTNSYHPTSGGISTFYRALLDAANRERRQMRLVAPAETSYVEEVGDYGRIYYVEAPSSPIFDRRYRLLMPPQYAPPFRRELRRILEDERPDLIEICDKYSLCWLAGLLRRRWIPGLSRPVLVGLSCERMDDNIAAFLTRRPIGHRLSQEYLGQLYLPLFDYHLANSQYTADELLSAMKPGHQRPVHVLPMGAEVEEFRAARASDAFRRSLLDEVQGTGRTRLLLYAGRLSPEKNISLLIELMEILQAERAEDYRLLIAGSGPLADWLANETRGRAPGRIHFLGHIADRRRMVDIYVNSDAFVHPNPREPFGIAPLEAMAAGIPLVAPRSGGVLSYANDANAWLCEPNAESYVDAIRAIVNDPARRKDKLAQARWAARQYNWESVTRLFFERYDSMMSEFPTTRFAHLHSGRLNPQPKNSMVHE